MTCGMPCRPKALTGLRTSAEGATQSMFAIIPTRWKLDVRCWVFGVSAPLLRYHSHHRQRKTQSQFVLKINLDVMQPELLELHPAKVMNVRGVPFHFL
jgi:hypothetical protein